LQGLVPVARVSFKRAVYQLSLDKTEIDSRSHLTTIEMQVVLGVRRDRSLDEGQGRLPGSESAHRWPGASILSVAVPFGVNAGILMVKPAHARSGR
jgi:hypothetical protein